MTIYEANNKIKELENLLEYLYNTKELFFIKTQPKSLDTTKERIIGGKRDDPILQYILNCEKADLDNYIEKTKKQIINLSKFVENELKRIGEYEPLEAKIIKLREISNLTWEKIGEATFYSSRQCRRIYKKYKRTNMSI